MPAAHTYPGVYIEEVPSGVRTIVGVSTSNTAFVDYFPRGSVGVAVRITSWADFEREFGGLDAASEASYAIQQFYLNGGQIAFVVRTALGSATAFLKLQLSGSATIDALTLDARNPGEWGNSVQVAALQIPGDPNHFNLAVREMPPGATTPVKTEVFRNLNLQSGDPNNAQDVVNAGSSLVTVPANGMHLGGLPDLVAANATGDAPASATDFQALTQGSGPTTQLGASDLYGDELTSTGMYALDRIAPEIFNILCIPAAATLTTPNDVYTKAIKYCEDKRAFLIVDIPKTTTTPSGMQTYMGTIDKTNNAAVYFPRLQMPDPLQNMRPREVGSSGTLAGIYSRTDSTRGVWKAPAGTDAVLKNATLTVKLTDLENGGLNPFGINVLRNFPVFGTIAWGSRTLNGADQLASEWKYVPVRRTALFIEESLYEALKWVVFEPNDEPLWAQIRLNVGAFMHDLFRQGAFQGNSPDKAYFVKCDSETTTQNDIDQGVVNIWVGFAPLKPAEFVVIKIQQIAGQIQT